MARGSLDSPLFDADDFVDPGGIETGLPAQGHDTDPLALALDDLLPASDGSVIFDADVPVAVEFTGGRHIIDRGVADDRAEAGGDSVAGYHYVAFDDGLTLFYPPEASLVLVES